ncbi:MAG: hypothetical protein L3J58_09710 [Emcibacter sp.]|nr:hypothetical protein [Emcibacter sp.]
MNKKTILVGPIMALLASGCASVMSGTDQDIAVHTNPEGAECILTREGLQLRKVTTPDNVRVSKLKHDIYVKCSMEGFHDSTAHVNSGTQGSVFGNILLGGGIGWAIDSARGADNKYADVVTVTMVPLGYNAPAIVNIDVDGKEVDKSEIEAKQEDVIEGEASDAQDTKSEDVSEAVAPEAPIATEVPVEPEEAKKAENKDAE